MSFNFRFFSQILRDFHCNTLLDVGANDGKWAKGLKSLSPRISITCVEANPKCEPMLASAGFEYKIAALSDKQKKVKFFSNPSNETCTGYSYYKENSAHYSKNLYIDAETTTLDNLFPDRFFDAIKLDTQGSELDILRGCPKLISRAKVIVMEVSYMNYNEGAPSIDDLNASPIWKEWKAVAVTGTSKDPTGKIFQEDIALVRKELF